MKQRLLTTIAALVLVGCGESQQSAPSVEAKPEPPTAKAPDISIHKAASGGNIEAVKQHIAAGTDVHAKSTLGETPLHHAAGEGHKEVVELLIAEGADVNAKDKWGMTPLHWAARKDRARVRLARRHQNLSRP
ncbi:MAG TPA: ankyrin repeat domain-containing protein [Alphaproteobacteria bacterium]|nr:ankyrin repeat domain-containing protein [Alphaproteobacteria bacterium]